MSTDVLIVGAGLAGLVCGRRLNRAGRDVLILDSDTRPGGRLKTDVIDGCLIDRGFQVYFTSYPHAKTEIDEQRLNLGQFVPGAAVWDGRRLREVRNDDDAAMAVSTFLPLSDKLRTMAWSQEAARMSWDEVWQLEDMPAGEFLTKRGFSDKFLRRFAQPFFGGIFLDRSLNVSCRMFAFVWKMLWEGQIGVPGEGMEAIPRQIAADIPDSRFRMGCRVSSLIRRDGAVRGVRLSTGEEIEAQTVVLATEAPEAVRLAGISAPLDAVSCTTISYLADRPATEEPMLVLNGPGHGMVNHVVDMSMAAPGYAPPGKSLFYATILGTPNADDLYLARSAQYEVSQWLPKAGVDRWRPLRVDRIRYAQMPQPAGFRDSMPMAGQAEPGLMLAGEYTQYSSIDGAVLSGQQCARAILSQRDEQAA